MIFWMSTGQVYSELNGSYKKLFRLGRLHLNAGGLCPIRARASIEYWQIDELLLGESPPDSTPTTCIIYTLYIYM